MKHWIIVCLSVLLLLPCTAKQAVKLQAGLPVETNSPQGKQAKIACAAYSQTLLSPTANQVRNRVVPGPNPLGHFTPEAVADQVLILYLTLPPPVSTLPIYIQHERYLI